MDDRVRLDEIVDSVLGPLYENRMKKLADLKLAEILSKNVFMFRALGVRTPTDFVDTALSAFTSSSDETKFGVKFFEPIVEKVSGGKLTDTLGMDIVIERPREHILIAIKSGPN